MCLDNEKQVPTDGDFAERREALLRRSVELTKRFRPYLVGLLANEVLTSSGLPAASGTGVLIRSPETTFVVTAAHVWDDVLAGASYLRVGNAVIARHSVTLIGYDYERDVATLRLPPNDGQTGATAFPFEKIGRASRWKDTAVLGFPLKEIIPQIRDSTPGLHFVPAIIYPMPAEFDKVRRWFGSEPADWHKMDVAKGNSALVAAPDIGGVSGGPVFQDLEGDSKLVGVHVARTGGNVKERRFWFAALWDILPDGSLRPAISDV